MTVARRFAVNVQFSTEVRAGIAAARLPIAEILTCAVATLCSRRKAIQQHVALRSRTITRPTCAATVSYREVRQRDGAVGASFSIQQTKCDATTE